MAEECRYPRPTLGRRLSYPPSTWFYVDTGPCVVLVQTRLKAAGFYTGPINGIYDIATENAVKAFQRSKGITYQIGVVSGRTWEEIMKIPTPVEPIPEPEPSPQPTTCNPPYPTLKRGSTGVCVKLLQNRLNIHGFSLAVDGIFGPKTEAAVIEFQRFKRITVDGIVGPQTWGELMKVPGSPVPKPEPQPEPEPSPEPQPQPEPEPSKPESWLRKNWYYVVGIGALGIIVVVYMGRKELEPER